MQHDVAAGVDAALALFKRPVQRDAHLDDVAADFPDMTITQLSGPLQALDPARV